MPPTSKMMLNALLKLGFVVVRQNGSHCILQHPNGRVTIVPMHAKDLGKGVYFSILKQAGITQADLKKQ
jgi:mRNA interferase HicA